MVCFNLRENCDGLVDYLRRNFLANDILPNISKTAEIIRNKEPVRWRNCNNQIKLCHTHRFI